MSEVAICNQALAYLGEGRITSLNDDVQDGQTPEAIRAGRCKDLYAPTRDTLLEAFDWTFAAKQESLVPELDPPLHQYTFSYLLPADCLSVWWVGQNPASGRQLTEWERVSNRIYANVNTNSSSIIIWYTRREEDPTVFSAGFRDALATRLAAEMCMSFTESPGRTQQLWQLYEAKVQNAVAAEGVQGRTRLTTATKLTRVRGRGGFGFFQSGPPLA